MTKISKRNWKEKNVEPTNKCWKSDVNIVIFFSRFCAKMYDWWTLSSTKIFVNNKQVFDGFSSRPSFRAFLSFFSNFSSLMIDWHFTRLGLVSLLFSADVRAISMVNFHFVFLSVSSFFLIFKYEMKWSFSWPHQADKNLKYSFVFIFVFCKENTRLLLFCHLLILSTVRFVFFFMTLYRCSLFSFSVLHRFSWLQIDFVFIISLQADIIILRLTVHYKKINK